MAANGAALTDRRPTFLLDTPCLTRQYTFRPLQKSDPIVAPRDKYEKSLGHIVVCVNRYLKIIGGYPELFFDAMKQAPDSTSTDSRSRYDTIFRRIDLDNVPVEVLVEIHTEYFTINFRAYPASCSNPEGQIARACEQLEQLCRLDEAYPIHNNDSEADELVNYLYESFWTKHLGAQFDPAKHFCGGEGAEFELIAEFTGLVLRRANSASEYLEFSNLLESDRHSNADKPAIASDFMDEQAEESLRKAPKTMKRLWQPESPRKRIETWDLDFPAKLVYSRFVDCQLLLNQNSRFFTRVIGFRNGDTKYADHLGGNTVLSGFLDGLSIYGSSFGRKPNEATTINKVRYFVIYAGPSRNQLARLIRRIHACGENRIFALIDFENVRRAGNILRQISIEFDEKLDGGSLNLKAWEELRQRTSHASVIVRGGLKHRVSRSEYYFATLRKRIGNLRTRRIFGWQTYDEFIDRIFEPQLETYVRIGERLTEIETRLSQYEAMATSKIALDLQQLGIPVLILGATNLLGDVLFSIIDAKLGRQETYWFGDKDLTHLTVTLALYSVAAVLIVGWFNRLRLRNWLKRQLGKSVGGPSSKGAGPAV